MGLVDEHFVICPWHQRRQDHRRYWHSQRRDSRVCLGPRRLESNTNSYLNAYSYVNANSDTCVHSYNYTYVYANGYNYSYVYANGNCDGYSNCYPYSNGYSQAHTYSATCSYAAAAPDGGPAPVMITVISEK